MTHGLDETTTDWWVSERRQRHLIMPHAGRGTGGKAAPGDDPAVPGLWKGLPQSQELEVTGRGPGSESALSAVCSRRL